DRRAREAGVRVRDAGVHGVERAGDRSAGSIDGGDCGLGDLADGSLGRADRVTERAVRRSGHVFCATIEQVATVADVERRERTVEALVRRSAAVREQLRMTGEVCGCLSRAGLELGRAVPEIAQRFRGLYASGHLLLTVDERDGFLRRAHLNGVARIAR